MCYIWPVIKENKSKKRKDQGVFRNGKDFIGFHLLVPCRIFISSVIIRYQDVLYLKQSICEILKIFIIFIIKWTFVKHISFTGITNVLSSPACEHWIKEMHEQEFAV